MADYRIALAAQVDILNILTWTQKQFGDVARKRYEALIITALHDVAEQPQRPGSVQRPELGVAVRSWHLRLSRERARTLNGVVRHPRHFLIYRPELHRIVLGRILHDAMELAHHFDAQTDWE